MIWLAIDTSTSVLGVGVVRDHTILGEMTTDLKRHHSERLLPLIQHLLHETRLQTGDIDGVAVIKGPGSYTGVRIGVTTAKVFAWSRDIPLIGVSSLAALAVNGIRFPGQVIPMWDARRERIYSGHYRFDQDSQLIVEKVDRVVSIHNWVQQLTTEPGPFFLLGDGAKAHRTAIQSGLGSKAHFSTPWENIIRPSAIAHLAAEQWHQKGEGDPLPGFAPVYLQPTEAEKNWAKRN